jgi:hypothetical protein
MFKKNKLYALTGTFFFLNVHLYQQSTLVPKFRMSSFQIIQLKHEQNLELIFDIISEC